MREKYFNSMFNRYPENSEQQKFVAEWLKTQDAKDLERILKSFKSQFKEAWKLQPLDMDVHDEAGEKCEEICLGLMN